ncbi:peptidase M28 [Brunnivagina elsteri CCALA 953]|uniref:Peptidase M28 n=1 Tax=Brunnivagina elsteri CCALA 953 TaxID=987040 RepID=A0A2A2TFG4_9CYAN|nr:peptidase M28 [Calothrix elsteri CCALA 953]
MGIEIDVNSVSQEIYQLISALYPICRSITGDGVRKTLNFVQQHISLALHEVKTGTPVFDWTVPKEWNIRDAYIKNSRGEKIIDFQKLNLHVLNYSLPVNQKIQLEELKKHLISIPDKPDWVPYRTSYYKETWGFCLSHNQLLQIQDDEYEVYIDSTLEDGSLTYGEYFIPGETDEEVLISCHTCHPSLANDNLAGIALTTFLAQYLSQLKLKYSYRFIFIPGTIGSITWLARNEANVDKIKHGLVVTCIGDPGKSHYKKSRRGNAEIDKAAIHVLQRSGQDFVIQEFSPYGYDERQYCSPGFNLPVGCFMRSPHGTYPQYHTSADNLELVKPEYLADSLTKFLAVLNIIENNKKYLNQNPKCEPMLGKRGLYSAIGGQTDTKKRELAMLWVLNMSDGESSLLDIAEKSDLEFDLIKETADTLQQFNLLKEC